MQLFKRFALRRTFPTRTRSLLHTHLNDIISNKHFYHYYAAELKACVPVMSELKLPYKVNNSIIKNEIEWIGYKQNKLNNHVSLHFNCSNFFLIHIICNVGEIFFLFFHSYIFFNKDKKNITSQAFSLLLFWFIDYRTMLGQNLANIYCH